MAKSYGVHKIISFPVAGHTFATMVMPSNGVSIKTVPKFLGHIKLPTIRIYAKWSRAG